VAVQAFRSLDVPAGQRAAWWLRTEALLNHPSTVTQLLVVQGQVEAFFALCSATVKLSERHRKPVVGAERVHRVPPSQPAAKIAWLAKRRGSYVSGHEILLNAVGTALEIIEYGQGQIVIALDPVDDATEHFWRSRYGFKTSQPADGRVCLWRTLLPDPDTQPPLPPD